MSGSYNHAFATMGAGVKGSQFRVYPAECSYPGRAGAVNTTPSNLRLSGVITRDLTNGV